MVFDRLIESILKEGSNKDVFAIVYNDKLINVGDDIPLDSLLGKHMSGPLRMRDEPVFWTLGRLRLRDVQPEILTFPGNRKIVVIPDGFNKGTYHSVIGKIEADKMIRVTSYHLELVPRTDKAHAANVLTSGWVVHQSDNEDGTHTTWYNPMNGTGSSLTVDFEIVNKQDHERKTTIAAHKDHNELVDLIDL
jgi:hypothetical protein